MYYEELTGFSLRKTHLIDKLTNGDQNICRDRTIRIEKVVVNFNHNLLVYSISDWCSNDPFYSPIDLLLFTINMDDDCCDQQRKVGERSRALR